MIDRQRLFIRAPLVRPLPGDNRIAHEFFRPYNCLCFGVVGGKLRSVFLRCTAIELLEGLRDPGVESNPLRHGQLLTQRVLDQFVAEAVTVYRALYLVDHLDSQRFLRGRGDAGFIDLFA